MKKVCIALLAAAMLMSGTGTALGAARAYAAEAPEPVLAVSFDDETANDSSGNGNNGMITGTPTFTEGVNGKAIHLLNPEDRSEIASQYVNFGQPESLKFGAESFTIMFWYKAAADEAKEGAIISNKDWASGNNAGFNIGDMEEGINLNFNTVDSGRGRAETDRFAGATDGSWHHIAAVIDRTDRQQIALYIDGKEAFGGSGRYGTKTYTADIAAYTQTVDVTDFVLGADGVKRRGVADACIDELYVYKTALTQENIQRMVADDRRALEIQDMETAIAQVETGCRYTEEAIAKITRTIEEAKESMRQAQEAQKAEIMDKLRDAYEEFTDGAEPNMVFHLVSDVHVTGAASTAAENFAAGLRDMETVNPEAAAFVTLGDNTQNGTEPEVTAFFNVFKEYNPVKSGKVMIALGNHDVRGPGADWEDVPSKPHNAYWPTAYQLYMENNEEYMPETDGKTYFDYWVDGYHLIVLNPEDAPKDNAYLTEEQIVWLDEKLSENEESGKPALVFIHQALNGTHWRGDNYNGFGPQDAAVKAVLQAHPQTIVASGHIHNGFGVTEAIDRSYGTVVDVPAYQGSSSGLKDPGTGYEVYLYDDEVLFRARNFLTSTWLPEYDLSVKLESLPVLFAKAKDLRRQDYTTESWNAVSKQLRSAEASAELLMKKEYGAWNVTPDTWLYHRDTRKKIEELQKEFVSLFASLEEAPDLSKLLEEAEKARADAERRAEEAEAARADAEGRAEKAEAARADAEGRAEKAETEAKAASVSIEKLKHELEEAQGGNQKITAEKVSLKSVKSKKKKTAAVSWKKQENVSGYVIRYATNAKFKNAAVIRKAGAGKCSCELKKLKSGKTYYVQVCAYKILEDGTFYGKFGKAKKVKVK